MVMQLDTHKLLMLRVKGRSGGTITEDEDVWLQQCYKEYPLEYKEAGAEAFNLTKPFGSKND